MVGARLLRADARARAREGRRARAATVAYVHGNALELPFADASFDAATVGFGVRNVVDLERGDRRDGARRAARAAGS